MNLKKLTQAVFEGLPSEYRWAAVDRDGDCFVFGAIPEELDGYGWGCEHGTLSNYIGENFNTTDWQNSLIERQNVLTAADIDWSKAPEGATHWHEVEFVRWTGKKDMNLWNLDAWDDDCRWTESAYGFHGTLDDFLAYGAIPRPESIHDVARSIEAARVAEKSGNRCATCTANICSVIDGCYVQRAKEEAARVAEQFKVEPCPYGCVAATIEQSERTYPHYFKDVSGVDAIDLYHVARLYDIADPALFHAFKKIACAGKRGAKDQAQDVQEAIDALKRWKELNV